MSRITLALGSFMLGACCMAFLGSHTSTVAQEVPRVPPPSTACAMSAIGAMGPAPGSPTRLIGIPNSEPPVPGLAPAICSGSMKNGTQALDGLDCRNCTFDGVALEYAGGAYNLQDAQFSGVTRIVLKGAAANTVSILPLLAAIEAGQRLEQPNPNAPIIRSTTAKGLQRLSLVSPYK